MQKQGNDKSVVYNKPEYADVQILIEIFLILYTSPYHSFNTHVCGYSQQTVKR